MNLSLFLPAEVVVWALHWGLFSVIAVVGAFLVALLLRPFWLWYSGRSEELERLKRLDETSRKALFELEMLNETLAIPVKKAQQKARAAEKAAEAQEPMVVSEATKADFLKALEKSRSRVLEGDTGQ